MTISEAYRLFVEERQVNGVTQKTLMFYRDTAEKFQLPQCQCIEGKFTFQAKK
jgi:hypothetical protein